MKRINLLIIVFVTIVTGIRAEVKDSVTLVGKFTDEVRSEGGTFNLKVINERAGNAWPRYNETFSAVIKDGQFSLKIPAVSDLFYASLSASYTDGTGKLFYFTTIESMFLFEAGDSISLKIQKDHSIVFTGNGVEKLRCQQKIYASGAIQTQLLSRLMEMGNDKKYKNYYESLMPAILSSYRLKMDILDSYTELSDKVRERIASDIYGLTFYAYYNALYYISNSERSHWAQRSFEDHRSLKTLISNDESVSSFYLPQSLYLKEMVELKFKYNHSKKLPFGELFDAINKNYEGELRDQVMLLAFIQFPIYRTEVVSFIEKGLSVMGEGRSKEILQEWGQNVKNGEKAYNFQLFDHNGTLVKLDDFKGKIVVLDFWYTGCFGCKILPKYLKIVMDEFANRKDVVFISVNADKTKERWAEGLSFGYYTLPGQVELSTYPEGFSHPLMKHYNYFSYPQLLLIDKKGGNLSANPPDPRADNGEALIKMIYDNL